MLPVMDMRTAHEIIECLRANGFDSGGGVDRQVLALMEEAGEFVGAYRRWRGWARRTGSWEDVRAELADVAITTYVTLAEADLDIDQDLSWAKQPMQNDPFRAVLKVFRTVDSATRLYPLMPLSSCDLSSVVVAACQAAHVLEINLGAAVHDKLEIVFTRGWREPTNT
jgi:NTP pyrophosphatase (non-canonical NTP hydrolase)